VRVLLVVLAKEVLAVVVAVRRPQHRVDVVRLGTSLEMPSALPTGPAAWWSYSIRMTGLWMR
jgi:hypothetical protein